MNVAPVMAGLDPAIHSRSSLAEMAGSSSAMTISRRAKPARRPSHTVVLNYPSEL
jgi:hypothetical protein